MITNDSSAIIPVIIPEEMKIKMDPPTKQMRIDESVLDPICFRNFKATQKVLQKPQISQVTVQFQHLDGVTIKASSFTGNNKSSIRS